MEFVAVHDKSIAFDSEQRTYRPHLAVSSTFSLMQNPTTELLVELPREIISCKLNCESFLCSEKSAECFLRYPVGIFKTLNKRAESFHQKAVNRKDSETESSFRRRL